MKRTLLSLLLLAPFVARTQSLNIQFQANLPYSGQTCANVWSYVDTTGREYALVGASNGLSIVDVTNPAAPFEVKQIPGPNSLWREVETWGRYAYVVTEGGGGLQIVDLRNLPGTNLPDTFWTPTINSQTLNSIHALHTANGKVYLYGSNIGNKGAIIADVVTNPMSPIYLGKYDIAYVHDGYVRNDTMYACHIYSGQVAVVDVSNPASPVVLQTFGTPGAFTHNSWLTNDSKHLFTTDEASNDYVTCYDVSNLGNVFETDRVQSNPGSGSIPHNVQVLNDWVVTSYYRDGVAIFDGHRPTNLVEVGYYDTYSGSGNGFDGAWGACPYLPSGTILVTNINEGLFTLTPTYVLACYLEGNITNFATGNPLSGASVQIMSTNASDLSAANGNYGTGLATAGSYTVQYSKTGFITQTYTLSLTNGNVTVQNVALVPIGFSVNETSQLAGHLSAYPNPYSSASQVEYFLNDEVKEDAALRIFDVTGKMISENRLSSREGKMQLPSSLDNGMYFIRLVNGGKTSSVLKVVKAE